MKLKIIGFMCGLMLASLAVRSTAQDKTAVRYTPATTSVAIIPIVNLSGEKDEHFKASQKASGDKELNQEFMEHGFKRIDDGIIANAISDLKIDLSDEEQQNKATLYRIGKAVNADLVVFAVITHTDQKFISGILANRREGKATVKLWLLDAKDQTPILSAVNREGKSGGGFFAGLDKGSARIVIAVANAERDTLKDFFKPYSKIKNEDKAKR